MAAASLAAETDDHGDTFAASSPLGFGVVVTGQLGSHEDVDMFRLDLASRADVVAFSTRQLDTVGTLYDSDGSVLVEDDDGGSALNFRIRRVLDRGVYYIGISSHVDIGDYSVVARIVHEGDDHGGSPEAATILPLDVRAIGRIAPTNADVDVFRIDLKSRTDLRIYATGALRTVGTLLDSAGVTVARNVSASGNFRIERCLEAGAHYVAVTADFAGAYNIIAAPKATGQCLTDDDREPVEPRETTWAVFRASVSQPIVQERCIACHVDGGAAMDTDLVFVTTGDPDHETTNYEVFRSYLSDQGEGDPASLLLDKVRGFAGHGGGRQIPGGSSDFVALKAFTELVGKLRAGKPSADARVLLWSLDERLAHFGKSEYSAVLIDSGTDHLPLLDAPVNFADLTYEADGQTYALEEYLAAFSVAGLLVVKEQRILLERYRLGHDDTSRWPTWSVAKSVTSMLVGAAIKDGYIGSVDEKVVHYLPRMRGQRLRRCSHPGSSANGIRRFLVRELPGPGHGRVPRQSADQHRPLRLPRTEAEGGLSWNGLQLQLRGNRATRRRAARCGRRKRVELSGSQDLEAVHGATRRLGGRGRTTWP